MTAAHGAADFEGLLAAIERIEAEQPGFQERLAVGLMERLRRENPDAFREVLREATAACSRRLLERADQIARMWHPRDLRVRAALRVATADMGDPDRGYAAKRQAILRALFELQHMNPIERALRWSRLPVSRRLTRPAIVLAEESLCGEAPLWSVEAERQHRARRSSVTSSGRSSVPVEPLNLDKLPADTEDPLDALIADEDRERDTFVGALLDRVVGREEEYLDLLTKRVSRCIEAGQPLERLPEMDAEIAQEMGLATVTVRVYRSTILKKAAALRRAAPD